MKRIFLGSMFTICLLPRFSFAADQPYELRLAPSLGYSSLTGFAGGADVALQLPVVGRWQWKVEGSLFVAADYGGAYSLSSGPVYNLSDDRPRAYFIGAGLGWSDRARSEPSEGRARSAFVYSEFGKRFKLNDSGTWAWTPNMKASSEMKGRVYLAITPLSFSWSF